MTRKIAPALVGVLALSLLAGYPSAFAAPTDSGTPAKGSGEVTVYSGLNEYDMGPIADAFEKATGIHMNYIVGNIGDLTARVDAEKANPQADVLFGGSVDVYDPLSKSGDFEKYSSPANASLDKLFNDPNGYWQGWYMGVLSIITNTQSGPKGDDVPKNWDDLIKPEYKGKVMVANPATAGGTQVFINDQIFRLGGEDQAWDYMKKLDANIGNYPAGMTDVINLVGQGEAQIGVAWAHDSLTAQLKGSPINIIIPPDTAYEIGGAAIIKNAPDEANARALIDWLLTPEAQELNTTDSHRYPVRDDVAPPKGMPNLTNVQVEADYNRAVAGSRVNDIKATFQSQIMDHR